LKRIVVFLLLIAVGAIPCAGEVRLHLSSGQVLEGTDVRREDGNYYLTMMDGGVIPIPQELVTSVELIGDKKEPPPEDDKPVWPPTGFTPSKPQQLEGQAVTPPSRREQLEALGDPSKFQQGVFDPYWHPESDWKIDPTNPNRNDFAPSEWTESIIDPDWVPENAYPEDHIEFAPSEFKENIIDPSWVPQDAFKKKTSFRTASAQRFMTGRTTILPSQPPPPLDAFEGRGLAFSASYEDGRALSGRCRTCSGGGGTVLATWIRNKPVPSERAASSSDPGACAEQLLEAYLELTESPKAGSAYNAVISENPVELASDSLRIDYAFAVSALLDPEISLRSETETILLYDDADLGRVRLAIESDRSVPRKERKRRANALIEQLEPPRVFHGPEGDVVTLCVWSGASGTVNRYEVRLLESGRVGVKRETI